MMTLEDVKRMKLPNLNVIQVKRLTNAENTCRMSTSNCAKEYWYDVFKKLCEKYGCIEYFRKVIN